MVVHNLWVQILSLTAISYCFAVLSITKAHISAIDVAYDKPHVSLCKFITCEMFSHVVSHMSHIKSHWHPAGIDAHWHKINIIYRNWKNNRIHDAIFLTLLAERKERKRHLVLIILKLLWIVDVTLTFGHFLWRDC